MFQDNKPLNFLFWTVTGIFVFLFVFLLVKLFPVYGSVVAFLWQLLLPFLISALIAYLLYPVIDKIHEQQVPRSLAILLIYIIILGGLGYLGYKVYPAIIQQLYQLQEQLPQLIGMYREFIYNLYDYTAFLPETVHDKMDELIYEAEAYIENLLTNVVRRFTKVFDMIITITVIPVIVFYFLKDFTAVKQRVKKWVPQKYHKHTGELMRAVDDGLGKYIRGQFIVCLFVALAAYAVFKFWDIPYAMLLAIIMGLTNIIPYFGPIIGAAPAVAITATISGKLTLLAIASIFLIQVIEGNFLSPFIVGKSIQIHPLAIIFALLLGSQISGVIGMILAVPFLVILKVVTSHFLRERYSN